MTGSGRHLPAEATTVTRQVGLYGLTRADRLHGLMAAQRLTQGRLAAVIGLSVPRVTQLISGRRVKISNPAVNTRMVRLEEMAGSPSVAAGDPAEIARVLADVTTATPTLTTVAVPVQPPGPGERAQAVRHLAAVAPPPVVRMAAAAGARHRPGRAAGGGSTADWAGRPRP